MVRNIHQGTYLNYRLIGLMSYFSEFKSVLVVDA